MLNPISLAFKKAKEEKRPALLTYTVAGDSSKKQSLEILKAISNYADILEVGVPHNTPVADGGQIQTSAYRAIKNGIKMNDIFKIVSDFKKSKNSDSEEDSSIESLNDSEDVDTGTSDDMIAETENNDIIIKLTLAADD